MELCKKCGKNPAIKSLCYDCKEELIHNTAGKYGFLPDEIRNPFDDGIDI